MLADPYFNTGERPADRIRVILLRSIAGNDGSRLGQAVALQQRHAKREERP